MSDEAREGKRRQDEDSSPGVRPGSEDQPRGEREKPQGKPREKENTSSEDTPRGGLPKSKGAFGTRLKRQHAELHGTAKPLGPLREKVRNATPRTTDTLVPRSLREALLDEYPLLAEIPGHRAMLQLASKLFPAVDRFLGKKTGWPVLQYETIFNAYGIHRNNGNTQPYSTKDLIGLFNTDICRLSVTGYHGHKAKARSVSCLELAPHIEERVREWQKLSPKALRKEDQVYLVSGKKATNGAARTQLREERKRALEEFTPHNAPTEAGACIIEYSQSRRSELYKNLRLDNLHRAALRLPMRPASREAALAQVRQLQQWADQRLKPSNSSARPSCDGYNPLLNLPRRLRPYLFTSRDMQGDLAKAQLAVFEKVARGLRLDAAVLREYLLRNREEEGFSLWDDLASWITDHEGGLASDPNALVLAVKKIYTIVFGGKAQTLLKEMQEAYNEHAQREGMASVSQERFQSVLSHPLIEELLRLRGKVLGVAAQHGLHDVDGTLKQRKDFEEGKTSTVLHWVASSYEQELVAAAINELAAEDERAQRASEQKGGRVQPEAQMWWYLYDGIIIRVLRDSSAMMERWQDRISQAVARRAEELGIITFMEWEVPGVHEADELPPGPANW